MMCTSLQETGIGKTVNAYRKHWSEVVGNFARCLVTKWKRLVQLMPEAIDEAQCAASAHSDVLITAGTEEKVSIIKADEQHVRTGPSKHRHSHAGDITTALKGCPSTAAKYDKGDKRNDDKTHSSRCSQSRTSAASSVLPQGYGEAGYSSHGHSVSQTSSSAIASGKCQEQSVSEEISSYSRAVTGSKSHHRKHHKSTKHPADDRCKEKFHSDGKLSAGGSKCASRKESDSLAGNRTDAAGSASDRTLHRSAKEFVSGGSVETSLSKSVKKETSTTRQEKRAAKVHVSDTHSSSNAGAATCTRAVVDSAGYISEHQNHTDVKTTTADDWSDNERSGMSFEQMLNYGNHDSVARRKKGTVSKHSKVHKSDSRGTSSSSPTKHSSKPDSRHISKHTFTVPKASSPNTSSAESGERESLRLSQQPVIPHPESQVCIVLWPLVNCLLTFNPSIISVW